MKDCNRAALFSVVFAAAAATAVSFRLWGTAVFSGLETFHWIGIMVARIIRDGE